MIFQKECLSLPKKYVGMRIYRIASDENSNPPTHAVVFVHGDKGWAVTSDGKDGVHLHSVADPKGVIRLLEDVSDESDKEAWKLWVLEGERNGWLDEVRNPDPNA